MSVFPTHPLSPESGSAEEPCKGKKIIKKRILLHTFFFTKPVKEHTILTSPYTDSGSRCRRGRRQRCSLRRKRRGRWHR